MTQPAIGIDLGTTNCAVAQVDEHGRAVIIPNALGQSITPSVVCFKDGQVFVGDEAKELQRAGAPAVAAFFKRQMGNRHFALQLAGRSYTATDLSALLLGRLKQDAERALGAAVSDVVITVPAYFRNPEREATLAAGRQAGFNVLQVVNEPTAAAIAYGMGGVKDERLMLVYDLGGGTFDVTVLKVAPGEIRVLTSDGDQELGGKDWDLRLLDWVDGQFSNEHGFSACEEAESAADLLVLVEEAKKRLTSSESTTIALASGGARGRYTIDRGTFAAMTSDLLERTATLTDKALTSRDLSPAQLDGVLLIGGSTRMPMVQDFVLRRLGHQPTKGVNVDEAVALGAAYVADEHRAPPARALERPRFGLPATVRTFDVTNHSLGMIALNKDRSAYCNSIILAKDSAIPGTQSRPFQHPVRGRPATIEVYVTQGESERPDEVSYLGRYAIHEVPPAPNGIQVIAVEYSYDRSGTVRVAAKVQSSDVPLRVTVEPLPEDVPGRFLGPPQPAEVPVHTTVYLVVDCSGSMSGRPIAEARRAAQRFVDNLDLTHCSVGLLAFHDSTSIALRACSNAKHIAKAIGRLDIGGGTTANPFREVHALLAREQGARFAVVLTDGQWSAQRAAVESACACHADEIGVVAIGFGDADEGFLKRIASTDEAGLFTDLGRLVETFEAIAQVITSGAGVASTAGRSSGPSALGWFGRKR